MDGQKLNAERKKYYKLFVDSIPSEKEDVFAYQLDLRAIDSFLIQRRIYPWINKKVCKYIGEGQSAVVELIFAKVLTGCSAQVLLECLQPICNEGTEEFVMKIWRYLIYIIGANKLGVIKHY